VATTQDIITRSLRRAGIVRIGEAPQARLSIEALSVLNDVLYSLPSEGIDMRLDETRTAEFLLSDTFFFWTPPLDIIQTSVDKFAYQGTWDASTNTPALTNATGTDGHVYKVSVAGSTELNSISEWAVNDFIIFAQPRHDALDPFSSYSSNWFKSVDSRRFNGGISAMLAVRLSEELGHDIAPSTVLDARKAREQLYNHCSKPPEKNNFDTGIVYTPTWARFNTDEAI